MVKALNQLTGGHLLAWKVVLATLVFAFAGVQVLLAARFWGVSTVPPMSTGVAARLHRNNGRLTILLAVLVAFTCLAGPAGPLSPVRVLLHSVFGSLVFAILAAKYAVLKLARGGDRLLPWIGGSLFLVFGAIWATSVADYVMAR